MKSVIVLSQKELIESIGHDELGLLIYREELEERMGARYGDSEVTIDEKALLHNVALENIKNADGAIDEAQLEEMHDQDVHAEMSYLFKNWGTLRKPAVFEALEIDSLKAQARELYAEIEKRTESLFLKYGAERFDYDLVEEVSEEFAATRDQRFFKFQIVDNVEAMKAGTAVFAKAYVKPLQLEMSYLKTRPKSLK